VEVQVQLVGVAGVAEQAEHLTAVTLPPTTFRRRLRGRRTRTAVPMSTTT
jgi:hypothetical protein